LNKELLELPKLEGSEDQERTTLTINVKESEELVISGRSITIGGVVDLVTRELERLQGDASRLTVVVRADERGQSRMVNEVVSALARLGLRQVRIAVQTPE
jgi:biopolymer transport protein ExbD